MDKNWRGDNAKVKKAKQLPQPLSALLINVAEALEEKEREEIAEICLEDFEADRQSRAEWDSMHADWIAVYNQRDYPVSAPWANSANESLGVLTEACNSFQARAYKAFFPTRMPIAALPVGKTSEALAERAKRVAKYLQWKLFIQDQTYKEEKSAMLLRVAIHGSDFSKTFFDPVMNRIVTRAVRAQDLYVNFHVGPINIEEVQRKTELIHLSLDEGRTRAYAGYFLTPPDPMMVNQTPQPQQEQADTDNGMRPPAAESEDLAEIIEQHRNLDIDQDGIAEPYKVWVDVTSRKLLRIEVRYEVDDLGRPINGRLPIEEYTHYRFLVNPDGFYGYGLGFLLGNTNIAINKMLRQYIDGTTLSIMGSMSGFISEELGLQKGPVSLELGKFKSVSASAEQVSKGIRTMEFKPPSDGLLRAIAQLESRAQRIGAVTDALAGDIQKVMQPTTVMTMVEQGLMLFTSVQEFLLQSWSKELNKVYRLNSMYFRGEEWFMSIGLDGTEQYFVKEEDFRDDMMILPIADPRLSSQQLRIQKAQFLMEQAFKNPLIATRPEILLKVTRRLFEEMEIEGIDGLLPRGPEEIPQPEPDAKAQAGAEKAEAKQAEIAIMQQKAQVESQARMQEVGIVAEESRQKMEIEREKSEFDFSLKAAKQQREQEQRLAEIVGNQALSRIEVRAKEKLERDKARAKAFTEALAAGNKAKAEAARTSRK